MAQTQPAHCQMGSASEQQHVLPSPKAPTRNNSAKNQALALMKNISKGPIKLFRISSSDQSDASTCTAETEFTDATCATERGTAENKVRFAVQSKVKLTISRHDITPTERSSAWYSENEYQDIARSCSKQIQKMNRGEELRDKKYCSRGLEQHTRIGCLNKMANRALSIQAVLVEQEQQIRDGIRDDESIAFMYHDVTSSSQLWATALGLQDRRAAELAMDDCEIDMPEVLSNNVISNANNASGTSDSKSRPRRIVNGARAA